MMIKQQLPISTEGLDPTFWATQAPLVPPSTICRDSPHRPRQNRNQRKLSPSSGDEFTFMEEIRRPRIERAASKQPSQLAQKQNTHNCRSYQLSKSIYSNLVESAATTFKAFLKIYAVPFFARCSDVFFPDILPIPLWSGNVQTFFLVSSSFFCGSLLV